MLSFVLDLQNVNITLRILFRPVATELPKIYMTLGGDYDERVLPSITNEVLKAVVVRKYTIPICFVMISYTSLIINGFWPINKHTTLPILILSSLLSLGVNSQLL